MTVSDKLEVPDGHSLHHVVCPHDCPDTCSMLVTRDDKSGRAVKVQGDPSHPITRGYLCNKVNHYLDYVYSDKRMLYPHKRIGRKGPGAKFERISWDQALDTISTNFRRIIETFGSEAIQPFNFSGTLGLINYFGMDNRFWNKMEAARLELSICVHVAFWANVHTHGLACGPDVSIAAQDAELMIFWGHNPVSTGVHAMPFIREARARGCKIVVIDPRPTRTAWFADIHIQPKPGTDSALALAMMKVIVDHNLHDLDFLRQHTHGWQELIEQRLPEYSLEVASEITGVKPGTIESLALLYASTRKSYIKGGFGLNRHQNSGQMCRSVLILPSITGAWRERCGGATFGRVEENTVPFAFETFQRDDLGDRPNKRILNMVQMARALNDDVGWDEEPLDPPIKCLFTYNADPANCVPNSDYMRRGMLREDLFTVVHDTFWTDSCDYADIVLPADTQLERADMHGCYGYYHYGMNLPVIESLGESVSNSELFRRLAKSMDYVESSGDAFTQTDEEIIRDVLLASDVSPLLEGLEYEDFKKNGWFVGNYDSPSRNFLKNGWPTKDGRIQIYSEELKGLGQDPLPCHLPEMEGQEDPKRDKYPLQVVSSASHYFIGNSFQSVERLQAMNSRQTIEISSIEAAARNISDGDLCRLYNDRGETFGYALILDNYLNGMVGVQKQLKGSSTPGGVNVNALNTEVLADFGFGPSFYSVLAEIEKVSEKDAECAKVRHWGGREGYIRMWRRLNPTSALSDREIVLAAEDENPDIFRD